MQGAELRVAIVDHKIPVETLQNRRFNPLWAHRCPGLSKKDSRNSVFRVVQGLGETNRPRTIPDQFRA